MDSLRRINLRMISGKPFISSTKQARNSTEIFWSFGRGIPLSSPIFYITGVIKNKQYRNHWVKATRNEDDSWFYSRTQGHFETRRAFDEQEIEDMLIRYREEIFSNIEKELHWVGSYNIRKIIQNTRGKAYKEILADQ